MAVETDVAGVDCVEGSEELPAEQNLVDPKPDKGKPGQQELPCHLTLVFVAFVGSGIEDENNVATPCEGEPVTIVSVFVDPFGVARVCDDCGQGHLALRTQEEGTEASDVGVGEDEALLLDVADGWKRIATELQGTLVQAIEEMPNVHRFGQDSP